MPIAKISAHDMFDVIDSAVNGSEFEAGRIDAVAHVGMLIAGTKTPEEISDIQDDIESPETARDYARGYAEAWRKLYAVIF